MPYVSEGVHPSPRPEVPSKPPTFRELVTQSASLHRPSSEPPATRWVEWRIGRAVVQTARGGLWLVRLLVQYRWLGHGLVALVAWLAAWLAYRWTHGR